MYDVDAIEAINIDQLVTATDRLLLRRGRQKRASRPAIDLARYADAAVSASRARAAVVEKTHYVRGNTKRPFTISAAAFLAAAWLGFTFVCLLA